MFSPGSASWRNGSLHAAAVEANLDVLEGCEPFVNYRIDVVKKRLELFAGIHHFHDNREIQGQSLYLERVEAAVRAESHETSEDCGARQTTFPRAKNDPFVKRFPVVFVILPEKYSQQATFQRQGHGYLQT
jgi:hypothetical protein